MTPPTTPCLPYPISESNGQCTFFLGDSTSVTPHIAGALAVALAENGEFREAAHWARQGLKRAGYSNGAKALLSKILEYSLDNVPYRHPPDQAPDWF